MKEVFPNYLKELDSNYGHTSSSTDFKYYIDENVKVISKELKEYDGLELEYVAIMPINQELNSYVSNIKASDLNTLINSLKEIKFDNFNDGVVTKIYGRLPMFKFDYKLDLQEDLNHLGIIDVFDISKSDLSNMVNTNAAISEVNHEANIEFSNEGIKASAVTGIFGVGAGECGFDYHYDVPVEEIDLTFIKPYMFLIRDVNSGEVWFTGTVYNPTAAEY